MVHISEIQSAVEDYVRKLFREQLPEKLCFHNIDHTEMVVTASEEISRGMEISPENLEIILIAAWFHDTGYTRVYIGHEEESKKIAREFLNRYGYKPSKINKVIRCIGATQLGYTPKDTLEKVLCDADMYHLAHREYFKWLKKLRDEWKLVFNSNVSDDQWRLQNFNFLNHHRFCTSYARKTLEKRKQKNLQKNINAMEGQRHGKQ